MSGWLPRTKRGLAVATDGRPLTARQLLGLAEALLQMAHTEQADGDLLLLVRAAARGDWAIHAAQSVLVDAFVRAGHLEPVYRHRRDVLHKLAERVEGRDPVLGARLWRFAALFNDARHVLGLRREELAEVMPELVRRQLREVRLRLVPLARELVRGVVPLAPPPLARPVGMSN